MPREVNAHVIEWMATERRCLCSVGVYAALSLVDGTKRWILIGQICIFIMRISSKTKNTNIMIKLKVNVRKERERER